MLPLLFMIPVIVSGLYLAVEMFSRDLSHRHLAILGAWFLSAGYLQFRGGSPALSAAGLAAQVFLAIYLRLRVTLAQGSK